MCIELASSAGCEFGKQYQDAAPVDSSEVKLAPNATAENGGLQGEPVQRPTSCAAAEVDASCDAPGSAAAELEVKQDAGLVKQNDPDIDASTPLLSTVS